MKGLSPNISGTFTVDCSFIIENSIFTNLLVVPAGKLKKVKTFTLHFMNFIKSIIIFHQEMKVYRDGERMRDEKKEAVSVSVRCDEYVV